MRRLMSATRENATRAARYFRNAFSRTRGRQETNRPLEATSTSTSDELLREAFPIPDVKRALILCQRKTGSNHGSDLDVEISVVPRIDSYIQSLFPGSQVIIEYMTPGLINGRLDGTADFNFALSNEGQGREFINDHQNYYDLVMLNTCPIPLMDFSIIHEILKATGLLVIVAFNPDPSSDPKLDVSKKLLFKSWIYEGLTIGDYFYDFFQDTDDKNIFAKKSTKSNPMHDIGG